MKKLLSKTTVKPTVPWYKSKVFLAVVGLTIGCVITAIVGGILFLFLSYKSVVVKPLSPLGDRSPSAPTATPTPTPDPNRPFGVLLMGFGGPTHSGGYLTDTMILAYVEPLRKTISLITVPRDLWVPLQTSENDTKYFKINAAYAIGRDDRKYPNKPIQYTGAAGGGVMAMDTIEKVTGLEVDHFVALSFDGFKKSIDTLGGVTVSVPETFDDYFYPIKGEENNTCGFSEEDIATATASLKGDKLEQFFTCRYEHLHFDAGKTQMDGESALKFVRSRHSAQSGGDFSRSRRQKALILGVKEQVFSINFLPKAVPFITSLKQDAQTDIDLDQMAKYISKADEYREYKIQSIAISEGEVLKSSISSDRQYIIIPTAGIDQWDDVHRYVQDQLHPEDASPSATPSR